jgi:hypothetical protein
MAGAQVCEAKKNWSALTTEAVPDVIVLRCRRVRHEEDSFSLAVFQQTRSAYKRGVAHTIKGKMKEMQRQLKQQRETSEEKLERERAAAAQKRRAERGVAEARHAREMNAHRAAVRRCSWVLQAALPFPWPVLPPCRGQPLQSLHPQAFHSH